MKKILLALLLSIGVASAQPYGPGPTVPVNVQFKGTRITSTQSLVSGTVTKVQLNSIGIDTGSYWDGTNFWYRPLVAGTYQACGGVRVTTTGSTLTLLEVAISKNGTSGSGGIEISDEPISIITAVASDIGLSIPCSLVAMNGTTDTLELDVTANGTSPIVSNVRSVTQMSIKWVSP